MAQEENLEVEIPEGASGQERERLIQAAIDKKTAGDIDDVLGNF